MTVAGTTALFPCSAALAMGANSMVVPEIAVGIEGMDGCGSFSVTSGYNDCFSAGVEECIPLVGTIRTTTTTSFMADSNASSRRIPYIPAHSAADFMAERVEMARAHPGSAGVAFYLGAGISMESGLPSWYDLRDDIARMLLERTGALESEADYAYQILKQNWKVSPERTMRILFEDLGCDVLGAMQSLNSGMPAENHINIAMLMNKGKILHVVSLNFDTLIEQSAYSQGMWKIRSLELGADEKIEKISMARVAVDGVILEEREIPFEDISGGRAIIDGGDVGLFFVNDETTLGPKVLDQLTDASIPILHKPHGSSEVGREHTVIADFEGVDKAFPENIRRYLLNIMLGNTVVSMGVTWRDPDMSAMLIFLAALIEDTDPDAEWMSEDQREVANEILGLRNRIKSMRGLVLEAFPTVIPEQRRALFRFAEGAAVRLSLAAIEDKADPILDRLTRRLTGQSAEIRDPADKEKMLAAARAKAGDVLSDWAFAFVGDRQQMKQTVVYSVMRALQEADPSGKFEQEKKVQRDHELKTRLEGMSAGERRRVINELYPLSGIFAARMLRYIVLQDEGLLADWQYEHLMATLAKDETDYSKAHSHYIALVAEKDDGAPLSTRPLFTALREVVDNEEEAVDYLSDPEERSEFLMLWRGQRLKLLAYAELLKLHIIDANLEVPSQEAIQETRNTLQLFARVFGLKNHHFSTKERRTAERIVASSSEADAYIEIFNGESSFDMDRAEAFRVIGRETGGRGGDLANLLDAYVLAFHSLTVNWCLSEAKDCLAKAESLASLLNLPENHTLIRKMNTYKAYYLLIRSWSGDPDANGQILGLADTGENDLLASLAELHDKDQWLMTSDTVVQAIWSDAGFELDRADVRQKYEGILKPMMDWFERTPRRLNDRELQSFFFVVLAYFDLKYLRNDIPAYEELDPRMLKLTEGLMRQAEPGVGGDGTPVKRNVGTGGESIVPANYDTMFALYPHMKAVQTGDQEAYADACKKYERSVAAETSAYEKASKIDDPGKRKKAVTKAISKIFRQALLLVQLNVDMALREAKLASAARESGDAVVYDAHRMRMERYAGAARKDLEELRRYDLKSVGDERLQRKLVRFEGILSNLI